MSSQNESIDHLQEYVLRIIAFEDETSAQFKLDLNFQDLLTLTDGNIKLLEDENIFDLCQIIMNNLTMVQREKPVEVLQPQQSARGS